MALPVRVERGHMADPLESVRHDFSDLLGRVFGARFLGGDAQAGLGLAGYGVDIREDDDHIYIEADLPGFRREDIDITLEDGTLTIAAERRDEMETAGVPQQDGNGKRPQQGKQQPPQQQQPRRDQPNGDYLLRERRYARFVRSFTLPPNVDESNVEAKLENGVLNITLNKREESKPKRIQLR